MKIPVILLTGGIIILDEMNGSDTIATVKDKLKIRIKALGLWKKPMGDSMNNIILTSSPNGDKLDDKQTLGKLRYLYLYPADHIFNIIKISNIISPSKPLTGKGYKKRRTKRRKYSKNANLPKKKTKTKTKHRRRRRF